jgi:hypothetical protein
MARAAAEITILDAIDSPSIWRSWFRAPASWGPWRAFLAVLFGLRRGRARPVPTVHRPHDAAARRVRRKLAHMRAACGKILRPRVGRGVSGRVSRLVGLSQPG